MEDLKLPDTYERLSQETVGSRLENRSVICSEGTTRDFHVVYHVTFSSLYKVHTKTKVVRHSGLELSIHSQLSVFC